MVKKTKQVKKKIPDLMMGKDQLMKALEQSKLVEKQFPEFYLFTQMLEEMNKELLKGQFDLLEK